VQKYICPECHKELEVIAEGYEDARDEAFNSEIREWCKEKSLTYDDVKGFLESFTFPDEYEWSEIEYNNKLGTFDDARYLEFKDEK